MAPARKALHNKPHPDQGQTTFAGFNLYFFVNARLRNRLGFQSSYLLYSSTEAHPGKES